MDELDFKLLSVLNATHNITRTADLLYMTQSAVSRRISALEIELGTPLLTRTRKGVSFTPEGETVFKSTASAASIFTQMRSKLLEQKGFISGTVTLGVTNHSITPDFAKFITLYHERYPYINLKIVTDHSRKIVRRLADGEIDLCFVRGEHNWPEGRLLIKTEPVCLIRSERDKDIPLAELPYIDRITSQQPIRSINKWLHENNLPRTSSNIIAENMYACVYLVEQGLGWSILPGIAVQAFHGLTTQLYYQDGTPLLHNTWLFYAQQNLTLPAVKAFVELAQETHQL